MLVSCRKYPFAKNGHFIDGVDEYFNLDQQMNIWLYMDYLTYNGSSGLRVDSLYSRDKAIFQLIGLKGSAVQVLFTAKPTSRLNYHFAVLKHKRHKFDYSDYDKFQGKDSYYFYKDFEQDFLIIRHVLIPYREKKLLSMVYYVDKDKHEFDKFKKLNYLAEINAKELQGVESFRNFWQVFDCNPGKGLQVDFKIRQYLAAKHTTVYLKMYTLYENNRGISYAKVLTKKDPDSLSLFLCPNSYAIEYRNMRDDLLATDTLYVNE